MMHQRWITMWKKMVQKSQVHEDLTLGTRGCGSLPSHPGEQAREENPECLRYFCL